MMNIDSEICWYHGKISRESAENKLVEEGIEDGAFLVRDSNTSTGDFVLSVLFQKQVVHYQIRKHGEDAFFSIDENTTSHGLDSLIEYYQESAHGLISKLTKPCRGKPPPHDSRRNGTTNLLHRATAHGDYTIVSELIKAGYRLEAKNKDGQTAVHLASLMGNDEILTKLIDNGANVNSRDTAGYTPLHYACQGNFERTVELLVHAGGANVQARNTLTGWVPLHEAASRGHLKVVQTLLDLMAPARPRTLTNEVPAELARSNGHDDCADLLDSHEGPLPTTYRSEWYHGTLDRVEAISLIQQAGNIDGSFLVRFSDRNGGSYALTMLHEQQVFHFLIRSKDKYLFIDDGPYLESLEHVVGYYSTIADGLPGILKYPVAPKPKPPIPEFSTMPKQKKNNKSRGDNKAKDLYIDATQLEMGNVLGEGEFGSVIEGSYKDEKVAIKTLHKEHSKANREAFLREAHVMMKLKHDCIVRLIGVCMGSTLRMVQELAPLGSMLAYLLDHPDQISPNFELKVWAAQVACGMKYLEEQRFVHRDLATRNILLASRHQAKISDFGLSRAVGAGNDYYRAHEGGKWPLRWYAPESFNYGTFSHASDVWSYGVTLWEMFSYGQQPYADRKGVDVIKAIDAGERLEQPERCPDHVYAIMLRCWAYKADDRPTFHQLLTMFSLDTDYANIQELLMDMSLDP